MRVGVSQPVPRRRVVLAGLLVSIFALGALPGQGAADTGHPTQACDATRYLAHAGWDLCWDQHDARAQGIELSALLFKGEPVAANLGVPFTLTEYSNPGIGPYKDILGDSGANPGYGLGAMALDPADCPRFAGYGQLLHGGKLCVETRNGPEPILVIWGRFNVYNYRFMQGYELDSRGFIEPFLRLGGHLIDGNAGENGADHTHHLYWRLDLDIGEPGADTFEVFRSTNTPVDRFLPSECQPTPGSLTRWYTIAQECAMARDDGRTRWRVADLLDRNLLGRAKSYEIEVRSDDAVDAFSSFDVMVVQHKGHSSEIGYEVPQTPPGDAPLARYRTPAEAITDPVVWVAQHVYHDPRDEDRGSMTYHDASIVLKPRNLFAENPGEDTYA